MPLFKTTSDTARPPKRKLIGAHEAAVRENRRHREAGDKKADSAHDAAARGDVQHREADENES
jgi:hypothetical protein